MPTGDTPYRGEMGGAMPPRAAEEPPCAPATHGTRERRPLVLIVNPGGLHERGGMGGMVSYLLEAWAARENAPRALVLDSRGLGSVLFAPFYLFALLVRMAVLCATDDVALVHVNMAENTSVLRKGIVVFAGKLLKVPILLHLHAGLFIDFYRELPAPARLFTRLVLRAADRIVVLGELWKRMLSEELGIDAGRIAVVYNGVPAALPAAESHSSGPCRLLYVGKLRSEKGLRELLQALSSPRLKAAAWALTLVGTGDQARFERLAEAEGLSERVRFAGWLKREAVRRMLASSDVYVLPSHHEGLPLGLLEALAAGLAVVTTRVGALPEILCDGESALLVPRADVAALEEALFRVVTDGALRRRLAASALALYQSQFTIERFTAAIETQYGLLMRARTAKASA